MGAKPADVGERGFGAHPVGVVPDGGQQLAGDLDPDTEAGEQAGRGGADEVRSSASARRISVVRN
jgi:hypothetical protein